MSYMSFPNVPRIWTRVPTGTGLGQIGLWGLSGGWLWQIGRLLVSKGSAWQNAQPFLAFIASVLIKVWNNSVSVLNNQPCIFHLPPIVQKYQLTFPHFCATCFFTILHISAWWDFYGCGSRLHLGRVAHISPPTVKPVVHHQFLLLEIMFTSMFTFTFWQQGRLGQ